MSVLPSPLEIVSLVLAALFALAVIAFVLDLDLFFTGRPKPCAVRIRSDGRREQVPLEDPVYYDILRLYYRARDRYRSWRRSRATRP